MSINYITKVKSHNSAKKVILKVVNLITDTVKLTLGVEGAGVLLHRSFNRGARITNDGVTVAKCISPKDPFENLVAAAFIEGASKTGERVGDGTTSTTIIAAKLINESFKLIEPASDVEFVGASSAKVGVVKLKKRILACINPIKEAITKKTKKIKSQKELEDIANVALNDNKEVAAIIADIVWKTGENGFISLTDGFKQKLETEVIEGARFPMKVGALGFLTNPNRYEMVAEEAYCFVTNYAMDNLRSFSYVWNGINPNPQKVKTKLVVFAPSFSDDVLIQMKNMMLPMGGNGQRMPSGLQIFPVRCPSLGSSDNTPQNFNDLAAFVGANFINKEAGDKLEIVKEMDLGFIDKLTVKSVEDREDAVLIGGKGAKNKVVEERIKTLKEQKELTKMPEYKRLIDKRIASLASAGGLIKVGAATDAEALPLKHKIEDAVFACQAALKFGYVKGGGLCLKEIADELYKDDDLVKNALCSPYNQIRENAGEDLEIGKEIIDAAKVVELEVEHGFGVAASMITIKAIIPEFEPHDPKEGYALIADSIASYGKLWAIREGLIKEGKDEAKADALRKQEELINKEFED